MPHYTTSRRKQKAVHWSSQPNGTRDNTDEFGQVELGSPSEIDVRWEERQVEVLSPNGETVITDVIAVVEEDMIVGDILWLGALADLPGTPTNLKQVIAFNKVPNIKGRKYRRTVALIKYGDTLPDLA